MLLLRYACIFVNVKDLCMTLCEKEVVRVSASRICDPETDGDYFDYRNGYTENGDRFHHGRTWFSTSEEGYVHEYDLRKCKNKGN